MICVHNVVAASAVAGMEGEEGNVIRKTLGPALLYGVPCRHRRIYFNEDFVKRKSNS